MENATKALLIAAGVFVAMIAISIGVYLNIVFSNHTDEYNKTISSVELQKYNSKFLVYVGRDDINAQEIVSIVNLAEEYGGRVKIYLGNTQIRFTSSDTQEEFLKENQYDSFSCASNTSNSNPNPKYNSDGKIIRLRFTKNAS